MLQGLSSNEVLEKRKIVGKNTIETKRSFNIISAFLSQFPTFINLILVIGALFSFAISDFIDGVFILSVVIISSIFSFIQEYNAEKSLEKLRNYITPKTIVIRDGNRLQVPTAELVPEDIVILSEGDYIPADGKIVESHQLEIDESVLTGESIPVAKEKKDQVFSGTIISKGKGILRVEKIGMDTRFGNIAQNLSTIKTDKTPLQKNLATLGKVLSLIAIIAASLLIPIGLSQNKNIIELILLSISAAVSAIPEGLPAVITIALAIGTRKMAKKNAIVRKMSAIETLGSVQIILSDKTGTVTQNKMKVKKIWMKNKNDTDLIIKCCAIGNSASLIEKAGVNNFEAVGDKTDASLLLWANENTDHLKMALENGKLLDEYVFDPQTKLITNVWQEDNTKYVFVRGAPESVLKYSNLNSDKKIEIEKEFENYAKEGLRIIGFGYKILEDDTTTNRKKLEEDINFLGFVGISDPPRIEAVEAIKNAKKAGIKTVMVTGDNEITALAIAKEIGLIDGDENVINGDDLDKLSDQELEEVILKTSVFARTKPEDKLRLVNIYKKLGFIVGVTGDGVNDSLALKKADVGIAMGQTGTDVAKESADIVLTDDNFSTLIKAILEGRTIYNNIVKSIVYLLSSNLSEISLILFAAILRMPDPLLPTQILWINLVTDGLPALALASDNKNSSVLLESPRNPKEQILTKNRLLFIATIGFSLATFLIIIYFLLLKTNSPIMAKTIIFNLLIFSHLALAFFVRGKSFFKFNRLLIVSTIIAIVLQIFISTNPFFQELFKLGFK